MAASHTVDAACRYQASRPRCRRRVARVFGAQDAHAQRFDDSRPRSSAHEFYAPRSSAILAEIGPDLICATRRAPPSLSARADQARRRMKRRTPAPLDATFRRIAPFRYVVIDLMIEPADALRRRGAARYSARVPGERRVNSTRRPTYAARRRPPRGGARIARARCKAQNDGSS